LTDFQNSFTGTLFTKFAINQSLKVPPHLKPVAATLPSKILMLENYCVLCAVAVLLEGKIAGGPDVRQASSAILHKPI